MSIPVHHSQRWAITPVGFGRMALMWFALVLPTWLQAQRPVRWTAQVYPPRFEHLGRAQGLSQGTVGAILQDRRGFLWLGTEDGLNRYDGTGFRVFRHDPRDPGSMAPGQITSLLEDHRGCLWVGTDSGGLHRLDPSTERFEQFRATGQPGSLASDGVTCLAEDRQGNLWVGTAGGGLERLPPGEGGFQHLSQSVGGLPGNDVTALLVDHRGQLWVGFSPGGLCKVVVGARGWEFQPVLGTRGKSVPATILALAEDAAGRIWIGGPQGLQSLDPSTGALQDWTPGHSYVVRKLLVDSEGMLWVGTDGHGLDKVRPGAPPVFHHLDRGSFHGEDLSGDAIEALFEDRGGILWVGTYLRGLNKLILNPHRPGTREAPILRSYWPGRTAARGRGDCLVNAFLETRRGDLWVGTDGSGLNRVKAPTRVDEPLRFDAFQAGRGPGALQENVITTLLEDRQGRLWAGTFTKGLVRVDLDATGRPSFRHFMKSAGFGSEFILALWEDPRGAIFVGTVDAGLYRFDPDTGRAARIPLETTTGGVALPESVYSLLPDTLGTLWVGTNDGLYRLEPATGKVQRIPGGGGVGTLSHPQVRTMHLDRQGTLWVGTQAGGLNRAALPPLGTLPVFSQVGQGQGLPGGAVLGILEDEHGDLWISGTQGLAHVDVAHLVGRPLSPTGGLVSGEYGRNAYLKTRSGEFLFGGVGGFILFDPKELSPSRKAVPVVITDFQLFYQSVAVGQKVEGRVILPQPITNIQELVLGAHDRSLSFTFAALQFTAPEHNRFATFLEGLDVAWNPLGDRRFVTYTTLPPGTYTLRVKATNADGIWSESETRLRLVVRPPYWQTWWFRCLAGLALLSGAVAYVRLRLRGLRRRERLLQEQVEARTAELATANEALEQLATTDAKTGIANFRAFQDKFRLLWAQSNRERESLALVLIDLDHFKAYNDHLGHSQGDVCLHLVAQALLGSLRRAGDQVARYGGEEFTVLLQGTDHAGALRMVEQLRQVVLDLAMYHPSSSTGPVVSVSLGCIVGIPPRDQDFENFIRRADAALYRAKAQGRNQGCVDEA